MPVPVGEFKWITVVSPEGPDDIELALEPNENPVQKHSKKLFMSKAYLAQLFMFKIFN
jgi:hypothetical protein